MGIQKCVQSVVVGLVQWNSTSEFSFVPFLVFIAVFQMGTQRFHSTVVSFASIRKFVTQIIP